MKAFAELVERLAFTAGRNAKLAHIQRYMAQTALPDRGWALAVLSGALDIRQASASLLKEMVAQRHDPELFALSYAFVGDLAETIALIWSNEQSPTTQDIDLSLSAAVSLLGQTPKAQLSSAIAQALDTMAPTERLAFLKLATGNLRIGVSLRLMQTALAQSSQRTLEEITQLWHGLSPPYDTLWSWLEGGPPPAAAPAPFLPPMLAHPLDESDLASLTPADFIAEWKWDGIRVQATCENQTRRLYTRSGDDISAAFPDLIEALDFEGSFDGELLIKRGDEIAPFADVQKRLGRKTVSRSLRDSHPAALRLYDVLIWQGRDLRAQPLHERRALLQSITFASQRIDLSPLIAFDDWPDLAKERANPPSRVIEGVMLKRRDSPYLAGRPRGPWYKWKHDPMQIDAVLLYAQAGHGKRSGFYSDFTFGLWHEGELVPVGKAYSGFTDEELVQLDRFVRKHTTNRFGPVRQLEPALVVEVAFEGLNLSTRHKAGLAMRFPRLSRIRWDKPVAEADHLDTLRALL